MCQEQHWVGFGISGIVSITGHFPVIEFLSLGAYPSGSGRSHCWCPEDLVWVHKHSLINMHCCNLSTEGILSIFAVKTVCWQVRNELPWERRCFKQGYGPSFNCGLLRTRLILGIYYCNMYVFHWFQQLYVVNWYSTKYQLGTHI